MEQVVLGMKRRRKWNREWEWFVEEVRGGGGGGESVVPTSILGHKVGKRGPFCATLINSTIY